MARLPVPGSDVDDWGRILNDYLNQSLQADGTLRPIPQSKVINLESSLAAKVNIADLAPVATSGSYTDLQNTPIIPSVNDLASKTFVTNAINPVALVAQAAQPAQREDVEVKAIKYGDLLARPAKPTLIAIGDSITDNNHTATSWNGSSLSRTSGYRADGYLVRAMIMMRQPCSWFDVGISSQVTAQMLARFDSDVTPYAPQIVVEAGGTNDVRSGMNADLIISNRLAMWRKVYAWGGKVVATTIPPSVDSSTPQRRVAQQVNAWMRDYARANPAQFALVDWAPVLNDPLTGGIKVSMMDVAGVHPNTLGALMVAAKFAAAIGTFLPPTVDALPVDNVNDATNLMSTPLMTGTTGGKAGNYTGTNALGWFGSTTATTAVGAKVTRVDGLGEWQQITVTGSGTAAVNRNATGWSVGDVVVASCEFETDAAGWVDGTVDLRLLCLDAAGTVVLHLATALSVGQDSTVLGRMASGILRTPPIEIPTGTVSLRCDLMKLNAGVVRFGRIDIRKLVV